MRGLRRLGTRGGNGKDKLEPRLENTLLRFHFALFVKKIITVFLFSFDCGTLDCAFSK